MEAEHEKSDKLGRLHTSLTPTPSGPESALPNQAQPKSSQAWRTRSFGNRGTQAAAKQRWKSMSSPSHLRVLVPACLQLLRQRLQGISNPLTCSVDSGQSGVPWAGPAEVEYGQLTVASLLLVWNLIPQPTFSCQQLARATSETL